MKLALKAENPLLITDQITEPSNTKTNELKSLYEDADIKEKTDIVNLLKRIDPANSSKYQAILE